MLYLLLALLVSFAPEDINHAEITSNEKPYFSFTKVSSSVWEGTHKSGRKFTYTIIGNRKIQQKGKPAVDVINRLSISEIKTISHLSEKIDELNKDPNWQLQKLADGLRYARKTGTATYTITWSK